MENPIKWMIWGTPILGNLQLIIHHFETNLGASFEGLTKNGVLGLKITDDQKSMNSYQTIRTEWFSIGIAWIILNRLPKINERVVIGAPFGILIFMPKKESRILDQICPSYPYRLAAYKKRTFFSRERLHSQPGLDPPESVLLSHHIAPVGMISKNLIWGTKIW